MTGRLVEQVGRGGGVGAWGATVGVPFLLEVAFFLEVLVSGRDSLGGVLVMTVGLSSDSMRGGWGVGGVMEMGGVSPLSPCSLSVHCWCLPDDSSDYAFGKVFFAG